MDLRHTKQSEVPLFADNVERESLKEADKVLAAKMDGIKKMRADLESLHQKKLNLENISKGPAYTFILARLVQAVNRDTWLTQLTLDRRNREGDGMLIQLSGFSSDNDTLGDFLNRLSIEPLFKNVLLKYAREISNSSRGAVNSGDNGSRVEIIRAIGQRGTQKSFSTLHKVAKTDADESVRSEAILSMGRIGKATDIETLVQLAVTPREAGDRSSIEKAIVIVFNKIEDENAQADPVIAALKRAPNEAKPVLLSLLTRPATSKALEAVLVSIKSSDSKVSDAAITN